MRGLALLIVLCLIPQAGLAEETGAPENENTYSMQEILREVDNFFSAGAENLAEVVKKVFREKGRPNAFIRGEEAAAALGIGVRYGRGELHSKIGLSEKLYWQGPSIGFDAGANVSKVFILVYNLPAIDELFQRYPGVEGSLYFVGGVGVNYLQSGKTIVAPIRVGAGWRQGISAGYLDFTREASVIPL